MWVKVWKLRRKGEAFWIALAFFLVWFERQCETSPSSVYGGWHKWLRRIIVLVVVAHLETWIPSDYDPFHKLEPVVMFRRKGRNVILLPNNETLGA